MKYKNTLIILGIFLLSSLASATLDCNMSYISVPDIEGDTRGELIVKFNCSGSDINESSFIMTSTLESDLPSSLPNYFSIRVPPNDKADTSVPDINLEILRAHNRNVAGSFFETLGLFGDIFSYNVFDVPSGHVSIINGSTWAELTFNWTIEHTMFRNMFYLKRGALEAENKINQRWNVYSNNGILVEFYNIESMLNTSNYTIFTFHNVDYIGVPNKEYGIIYCNSSYNKIGGITPFDDTDNCVYASSYSYNDIDIKSYTSKNSTYFSGDIFAITNSYFGGIRVSDISYFYHYSDVPFNKRFLYAYANGTNPTNVSFNESETVWITSDNGVTFYTAPFTLDMGVMSINTADQIQLGCYVQNMTGGNFTNFTMYIDDVGSVNYDISKPSILYYCSGLGDTCSDGKDYNKTGFYSDMMAFHIGMAKDANGVGTVMHKLYLCNISGNIIYTINSSFYSVDDSNIYINFNTSLVPNGFYKINITAIADDNPLDIQSCLTYENFTIYNLGIGIVNLTYLGDNQICIIDIFNNESCLVYGDSYLYNSSLDYHIILKDYSFTIGLRSFFEIFQNLTWLIAVLIVLALLWFMMGFVKL